MVCQVEYGTGYRYVVLEQVSLMVCFYQQIWPYRPSGSGRQRQWLVLWEVSGSGTGSATMHFHQAISVTDVT